MKLRLVGFLPSRSLIEIPPLEPGPNVHSREPSKRRFFVRACTSLRPPQSLKNVCSKPKARSEHSAVAIVGLSVEVIRAHKGNRTGLMRRPVSPGFGCDVVRMLRCFNAEVKAAVDTNSFSKKSPFDSIFLFQVAGMADGFRA